MTTIRKSALASVVGACLLCAPNLYAQVQGVPSATGSSGSSTLGAVSPRPPRYVQILGVENINIGATPVMLATTLVPDNRIADTGEVGASFTPCLVDNYAGTVNLSVTSTSLSGPNNGFGKLYDGMGNVIDYVLRVRSNATTNMNAVVLDSRNVGGLGVLSYSYNSDATVTSAGACGSAAAKVNVDVLVPTMPQTGTSYTDTILLTLTPV